MMDDLLAQLTADPPECFALVYRPQSTGRREVEILTGTAGKASLLGDLPPVEPGGRLLAVIPYRQITELGMPCHDDGEPILTMAVERHDRVSPEAAVAAIDDWPTAPADPEFDIDDSAYADLVGRVLDSEIATGQGANFVIHRTLRSRLSGGPVPTQLLSAFRRLLLAESSAWWTFLIHTPDRSFVGASPERHVSLDRGTAVMNPISGTYRYPPGGPRLEEAVEFLGDQKETDELYMVVDEELKMMAKVCPDGGRLRGPYLKAMSRLAHTEYLIEGRTDRSPAEILHGTMFAPTVTGSPLDNAFNVIARHERGPRAYYSGVAALIGCDGDGAESLDSAILIRTADVAPDGDLRIGVGATLVRGSTAAGEVAETRAKAAAMMAAFGARSALDDRTAGPGAQVAAPADLADHRLVREALRSRNRGIAGFWLHGDGARPEPAPELLGRRGLLIEAEDAFTAMLALQLRALGTDMTVRRFSEPADLAGYDFVVLGPGPGDPRDLSVPKMAALDRMARRLLRDRTPLLGVCLGHQMIAGALGLRLRRLERPNQGTQSQIDLAGERHRVGFYNSYAAVSHTDTAVNPFTGGPLTFSRDPGSGRVHAMWGGNVAGAQFHPESVLTEHGPVILRSLLARVLSTSGA
ncbi:anthranilate synthase family protein [Glycomyces sp. TRM65418]|uniref:anthranilate synthase family protein n=1 Tax=Glycomyces sp. TRM65418 TaxID=2867006 RepID=UPI001CE6A80E|nr:anthranilate synthase family protein [Glycomyces sp. TRM65418]MCC3761591.1 anthranilate synthase family protein [Glycomyces sp. TRM65418]QZD55686.1 anthranilate synthase family protein [Glycomyces sp. TRM65418]